MFKFIDKIESLNRTIKILEKDKVIKDGLFKLTHEIKNPLAVCKGYIDMINLDNKEKANKYIGIMKQEINRSLNIISDFVFPIVCHYKNVYNYILPYMIKIYKSFLKKI